MAELLVLKTRTLLSILEKTGYKVVSQKGSHLKLKKTQNGKARTVIVPNHQEIRIGTLASIIRQMGISRNEFLELAKAH